MMDFLCLSVSFAIERSTYEMILPIVNRFFFPTHFCEIDLGSSEVLENSGRFRVKNRIIEPNRIH